MSGLLNWAGNILFFLIFLTVLENLLPNKKYSKYIRLFTGLVLILLVVQPIAKGLGLEEKLARSFEAITFHQQAEDLSKEIMGIEQQRLEQVIGSYETAVESELDAMAREMGYAPGRTQVTIEKDRNKEAYGSVVKIQMEVEDAQTGQERDKQVVQAVNPVELVAVDINAGEEGNSEAGRQEKSLEELRRKVESYYGLETGKVEIKFQRQ